MGIDHSRRQTGFTLMELMIVLIIVAVLSAIAYPGYTRYVQNTQETRAQGQLVSAMTAAESWRAQRFNYTGFTLPAAMAASDRYQFQAAVANDGRSLTITARPIGGQAGMGAMAINHRGQTCINKSSDSVCTIGTHPTWD